MYEIVFKMQLTRLYFDYYVGCIDKIASLYDVPSKVTFC